MRCPSFRTFRRSWLFVLLTVSSITAGVPYVVTQAGAQTTNPAPTRNPLTLQADIQEANAKTGVLTARGNVQIDYPARGIRATAAQAQYFSRERRIVLSGNVYIVQEGNSIRGETVTYLIDEGRFVALPASNQQVRSIYQVEESDATQTPATPAPGVAPF